MVEYITDSRTGDEYIYDGQSQRIFKNGTFVSPAQAEPIFSGNDRYNIPVFGGIFLKALDTILLRSGRTVKVTDLNTIDI